MTQKEWYLDEIQARDKDALIGHFRDREMHDNTLNIPHPYTEDDAEYWIKLKAKETKANGQPVTFAIRSANGDLIGSVGFDGLELGQTHTAEIGYWLAKPFWRRGIMTAAVSEACQIGFKEFSLVRIQAQVFSFNTRSSRVLEKCGFTQEGYLRKAVRKDGEYIDIRLFALINELAS